MNASNSFLNTFFDLCAHWLTSTVGITLICLVFPIIAVYVFCDFHGKFSPIIEQLRLMCEKLSTIASKEDFRDNFEDLNSAVEDTSVLKYPWKAFTKTLIFPKIMGEDGQEDEPEDNVILGTMEADSFFSRKTFIGRRINIRLINALPNLLTGAGILGTFLGLVAGIYLASDGLASSSVEQAKAALEKLLNGASLAFLTSISGLVSSIYFSIREKRLFHKFEHYRLRWVQGLDQKIQLVTPEKILHKLSREAKQQTLVLESFSSELAFNIGQAFDEKVTTPLAPLMEDVLAAISGLRDDSKNTNEQMLEQFIDKFSETITGAAGEEVKAFANTLDTLSSNMKLQIETLQEQSAKMERSHTETTEQLTKTFLESSEALQQQTAQTVEKISDSLLASVSEISGQFQESTGNIIEKLNTAMAGFEHVMENLNPALNNLFRITESNKEITSQQVKYVNTMQQSNKALEQTSHAIQSSAQDFNRVINQIHKVASDVLIGSEKVNESVEKLIDLRDEMHAEWHLYIKRFESVDKALENVFTQIDEGLDKYSDSVREFVLELDKHTASITKELAGAVGELQSTTEDMEDFRTSVATLVKAVDNFQRLVAKERS